MVAEATAAATNPSGRSDALLTLLNGALRTPHPKQPQESRKSGVKHAQVTLLRIKRCPVHAGTSAHLWKRLFAI